MNDEQKIGTLKTIMFDAIQNEEKLKELPQVVRDKVLTDDFRESGPVAILIDYLSFCLSKASVEDI